MNPDQKAAFINAAVARMLVELAAMQALNQQRLSVGASIAYGEDEILALLERHPDVHHNTICEFFRD